jgi:oligopeptide/dipeptide ABC transporter ATP-binding protein
MNTQQRIDLLLEVSSLKVNITIETATVHAVRDVSFSVSSGEMIAIVGESACGKSMTALSLLGLSREIPGALVTGSILFQPGKSTTERVDLVSLPLSDLKRIRGNEISIVFQDPMSSLNPVFTIGYQIMEPLMLHRGMTKAEAKSEAIRLLCSVGIADAEQRFSQFPHQLSGGMRQRVMIAMALSCRPSLLLADEPSTALDVTIQSQIISLIKDMQQQLNTAVILITHDLSIVAGTCSRILVMYAGRIVEETSATSFFTSPKHPYSRALLASIPRVDSKRTLTAIPGAPPDLSYPPQGCAFANRCPSADAICWQTDPTLSPSGSGKVACHHPFS